LLPLLRQGLVQFTQSIVQLPVLTPQLLDFLFLADLVDYQPP
jgi:hypothetical protein